MDYDSLVASFNDEVSDLYQSDPRALLESGLRLKSPAHIKVFLESSDDSLVVAHATAGVREKLIDLRRRLRDSTTFAVPAAFRVAPSPPPPRPECCMRRDCRCGIDDVMDLDAAAEPMVPPSKKEKKPPAPLTCPDCKSARRDTEGHVYWQKDWPHGITVHIKGFVNNMDEWMKASDCIVTKAGPGTIAEASICGLPCLLFAYL